MSSAPRVNRRVTRPDIRRGNSALLPARRIGAMRGSNADSLSQTSDRLMWWGWAVAIAFVVAGLVWHVATFQPSEDLFASQPANDAAQVVECKPLENE